jgi:hypothetical protein
MDKHLIKACAGVALAALAGQFLLGCGSAGSSRSSAPAKSPGASASVPFPVAVGNTWTYTLEIAGRPVPAGLVEKITGITAVPGGQRVSMAITSSVFGIPQTTHEAYLVGTDGSISFPPGPISSLMSPVNADKVIVPPLSVLNSGRSITWDDKIPPGDVRVTVRGGGTASVTVPAGTYRVMVVNMTATATMTGVDKPFVVVRRLWFAPHVGEVGEEFFNASSGPGSGVTVKLQSFTAG